MPGGGRGGGAAQGAAEAAVPRDGEAGAGAGQRRGRRVAALASRVRHIGGGSGEQSWSTDGEEAPGLACGWRGVEFWISARPSGLGVDAFCVGVPLSLGGPLGYTLDSDSRQGCPGSLRCFCFLRILRILLLLLRMMMMMMMASEVITLSILYM